MLIIQNPVVSHAQPENSIWVVCKPLNICFGIWSKC